METGASIGSAPLRFLLDTNAFISLEPFDGAIEPNQAAVAHAVQLMQKQGHRLFVHPASRDELGEGKDAVRVRQRLAQFAKYELLAEAPIPSGLKSRAGDSQPGTNDHRDLRLLAALYSKAVNYLISNDSGLRKRAARSGLAQSVLTAADAEALLVDFEPTLKRPPPKVERIEAYALDINQEIFTTLRQDYRDFDKWLDKVRADSDHRECFVIVDGDGTYAAIAILKPNEDDCEYKLRQPVTKICTFKVAPEKSGNRYGELLLKSVLQSHSYHRSSSAYVEVFGKQQRLLALLETFGYLPTGETTARGELVIAKQLYPVGDEALSSLAFHVKYGPPAISDATRFFIVPIIPEWHRQLFPDDEFEPEASGIQMELLSARDILTSVHPWGNALRKAYLCHSPSNQLEPGDGLLFYRSADWKAVTAIGVVEETMRSTDPDEIISVVGGRTVYTRENIERQCSKGPVLVILFRQDRFIETGWGISELLGADIVRSAPRSIQSIKGGGNAWIHAQLNA